jgi:hypothetical protein
MATARPAQTIAQLSQASAHQLQLQANSKLQISEQIFEEALIHIRTKLQTEAKQSGKASSGPSEREILLKDLAALHTPTDVEKLIRAQFERSAIWGTKAKIRPDGKLQEALAWLKRGKSAVDSIASAGKNSSSTAVEHGQCHQTDTLRRAYGGCSGVGCDLLLAHGESILLSPLATCICRALTGSLIKDRPGNPGDQ